MANEWFRWWHGSVTDPKFLWVSRRVTQCHGNIVTVWAALLEHASQARERGSIDGFDAASFDCLLGTEDGVVQKIVDAFAVKGMIKDGMLVGWDRRQPKREDQGNQCTGAKSAADRKRDQRERDKARQQGVSQEVTQSHEASQEVTLDKDKDKDKEVTPPTPRKRGPDDAPDGFDEFWSAYPRKVSKPRALKAWRKLSLDTQALPAILAGIERDRRSDQWLRDSGQFIPHPATWLNDRRWEDYDAALSWAAMNSPFAGCEQ